MMMLDDMDILFSSLCKHFPEFLNREDICHCYKSDFLNELVINPVYFPHFRRHITVFKYIIEQWLIYCNPINIAEHLTDLLRLTIKYEDLRNFLIACGADINGVCTGRPPFFSFDAFDNSGEFWNHIRQINGFDMNARNWLGDTILINFCRQIVFDGDEEKIAELLRTGSDVNAVNNMGESALICAVEYAMSEHYVKQLLDFGANINLRDKANRSAIFYAKQSSIKLLLLEHNARIDFVDENGLDVEQFQILRNRLCHSISVARSFDTIRQIVNENDLDYDSVYSAVQLAMHCNHFSDGFEICEKFIRKWKYLPSGIAFNIQEIIPHDSILLNTYTEEGTRVADKNNLKDQLLSGYRNENLLQSPSSEKLQRVQLPKCCVHKLSCEIMREGFTFNSIPAFLRDDIKRHENFGKFLQEYYMVENALQPETIGEIIQRVMLERFQIPPI